MAKKRANGEGNIRKRKDGRWEGRYTAGYDEKTGKRLIKNVLGKTQAEVKEKLAKAVAEAETVDVVRGAHHADHGQQRKAVIQQRRVDAPAFKVDDELAD